MYIINKGDRNGEEQWTRDKWDEWQKEDNLRDIHLIIKSHELKKRSEGVRLITANTYQMKPVSISDISVNRKLNSTEKHAFVDLVCR